MGDLTQEQRLALAVGAAVARARADRARELADAAERRTGPVAEAWERFQERHGRPPEEGELASAAILASAFAQGVTVEDLEAADRATAEAALASAVAADAHRAIADAMRASGADTSTTTLEWVGVDEDTFHRAVERALKEG
jgi:hypothetical protein